MGEVWDSMFPQWVKKEEKMRTTQEVIEERIHDNLYRNECGSYAIAFALLEVGKAWNRIATLMENETERLEAQQREYQKTKA